MWEMCDYSLGFCLIVGGHDAHMALVASIGVPKASHIFWLRSIGSSILDPANFES